MGGATAQDIAGTQDVSGPQNAATADSVARPAGPRIAFVTRVVDLGRFVADTVRECTFPFVNDGDSLLVVSAVTTDCGCTSARTSTDVVAPGDTGRIVVRFNGRGRQPAPFKKIIRVRSNAVDTPLTRLYITGSIKRDDKNW